jgi:hypothetical protein
MVMSNSASTTFQRIFRQPIKTYNMSKLKFSDGEEFDLSGPLRVILRADGFYVLGENMMMAVNTLKEGIEYINNKKFKKSK